MLHADERRVGTEHKRTQVERHNACFFQTMGYWGNGGVKRNEHVNDNYMEGKLFRQCRFDGINFHPQLVGK